VNIVLDVNGEHLTVNVPPEKRLVDVLRDDCSLNGTKADCYSGDCGSCTVIADNRLVRSCLIPAFAARGLEIMTIEGFSRTRAYREVVAGFADAGYRPCRYCAQARILGVHLLLESNLTPSETDILEASSMPYCRCADDASLFDAVSRIAVTRGRRRRGAYR
jgi:carbon-monoxide dehydrogenase small subunit